MVKYDSKTGVHSLREYWTSQASAEQRKGGAALFFLLIAGLLKLWLETCEFNKPTFLYHCSLALIFKLLQRRFSFEAFLNRHV